MEGDDVEMQRLWDVINELSEQLSQNRALTASLQAQVGVLKNQAAQCGSGSSLRRYNLDISKETFETELERTNAQVILEHQHLTQENKQLAALLKEFEQTLDTVMSKFRGHALAAQRHESTMIRHYETLMASRNSDAFTIASDPALVSAHAINPQHLDQLAHSLRLAFSSLSGSSDPAGETSAFDSDSEHPHTDENLDDNVPGDWTVEREAEILRLEAENAELRRLLRIDGPILPEETREMGLGMGLSISTMDTAVQSQSTHSSHFSSGTGIFAGNGGGGGGGSTGAGRLQTSFRRDSSPPQQQRKANVLPAPGGGASVGRGSGVGLAPASQIAGPTVVKSQGNWNGSNQFFRPI